MKQIAHEWKYRGEFIYSLNMTNSELVEPDSAFTKKPMGRPTSIKQQ